METIIVELTIADIEVVKTALKLAIKDLTVDITKVKKQLSANSILIVDSYKQGFVDVLNKLDEANVKA